MYPLFDTGASRSRVARLTFQLPRDSRVFVKLQPAAQWGWNEIFLNKMVFLLDTLVWQKTKDAQKKIPQNRPKLYLPDFMPKRPEKGSIAKDTVSHTTDEIRDLLARPRG